MRDQVEPLDAINNLIRELDEATQNPDSTDMALIDKPLFSSNERKLSAWAASNPVFTQAYERLRAKLPQHPNGTPNLDALARIGTEQRLLSEYLRVQRLIYNASKRQRRGAAGKANIDVRDTPSDAAAPASSRAKRKLHSVDKDDLEAARAFLESPSLPRTFNGHVNVHRLTADELQNFQEARLLLRNSSRRDKAKAQKLSLLPTLGDTAPRESMQQASSSIVASSAGTDGAASASSAATHHHDPAASLSRDSPPPSAVLPPHSSSAPSVSSSPSPLPMQPVVEPAAPPSPPRSSAPLLRWPSFSVPEYSPLDPW